jgi:hypothetical protein
MRFAHWHGGGWGGYGSYAGYGYGRGYGRGFYTPYNDWGSRYWASDVYYSDWDDCDDWY